MTITPTTSLLRARLAQETTILEKLKQSLAIGFNTGSRSSVEAKMEACKEAIRDITSQLEVVTKQIHKLYHVEFFDRDEKDKHHYFGSQSAIYDTFTVEEIGINPVALRAHASKSDWPYKNKKCIIRLGRVIRKHTLRGKKI